MNAQVKYFQMNGLTMTKTCFDTEAERNLEVAELVDNPNFKQNIHKIKFLQRSPDPPTS